MKPANIDDKSTIFRIYCPPAPTFHKTPRPLLTLSRSDPERDWLEWGVRSVKTNRGLLEEVELAEQRGLRPGAVVKDEAAGRLGFKDDGEQRPRSVVYLRGNTPVPFDPQFDYLVQEDLPLDIGLDGTPGFTLNTLLQVGWIHAADGGAPVRATAQRLGWRAKIVTRCRCNLSLNLRMERVQPILEAALEAGEWQIRADLLRELAG